MTGVGVRWSAEQVLALAPDAASSRAGSKLSSPGPWSGAGAGGGAVWGQCKGSGSKPYLTVVDLGGAGDGPGFKCSCPSRKFPCKHALGLLLLWAGGADAGSGGSAVPDEAGPPEWAEEWLSGRRQRALDRAQAAAGGARSGDSHRSADGAGAGSGGGTGDGSHDGDGTAAVRRAERRARRMAAGAAELQQRLTDLLHGGLAGADQAGYTAWDETAARMVDAQAPGLAARVRELGSVPGSGSGWPERLLAECALLHLLDRSLLRLEELPEPVAATVRSRVGLTVETAELLADEQARVRDEWLVLAQHDTEEGRLTARRIWLYGRRTERPALLLSFGAAGRAPGAALPVGAALEAELAFYPGAPALRAVLAEQYGEPGRAFVPGGAGAEAALAAYGGALREDPWLEDWPVVLRSAVPIPDERGGIAQLADAEDDSALPVAPGTGPARLWRLAAVSGGHPVPVFGTCGHRGFTPYATWRDGRVVQL